MAAGLGGSSQNGGASLGQPTYPPLVRPRRAGSPLLLRKLPTSSTRMAGSGCRFPSASRKYRWNDGPVKRQHTAARWARPGLHASVSAAIGSSLVGALLVVSMLLLAHVPVFRILLQRAPARTSRASLGDRGSAAMDAAGNGHAFGAKARQWVIHDVANGRVFVPRTFVRPGHEA